MSQVPAPIPLEDEVIDSFVIRSEKLSGFSPKPISPEKRQLLRIHPMINAAGHDRFWQNPSVLELSESDHRRLSMLSLFSCDAKTTKTLKPWFFATNDDAADTRASLAHCVRCTENDIANRGYSYWRREHQIPPNLYCLEHGFTIVDQCQHCGSKLDCNELPQPVCRSCGQPLLREEVNSASPESIKIFERVALACKEILVGKLRGRLDLAVIGAIVEDGVPCRTKGQFNNVSRVLCHKLGRPLLSKVGADPNTRPTYGWPAIYLSGNWHRRSPTFELLLFGVFGSKQKMKMLWGDTSKNSHGKHTTTKNLDSDLIRSFYKGKNTLERERLAAMKSDALYAAISPYPTLAKRAKAYRKRRASESEKS